jgi:hypothetical protein
MHFICLVLHSLHVTGAVAMHNYLTKISFIHENGLLSGRSDFRFPIILHILYNFFHTISDISAYSVRIVINNLKKYRVSKK